MNQPVSTHYFRSTILARKTCLHSPRAFKTKPQQQEQRPEVCDESFTEP